MLLALIWKEAREHVWKLIALLAMVLCPLFVLYWLEHTPWGSFGLRDFSAFIVFLAAWISPIWIASWTVASEKSSRTLATLLVLPINRFYPFMVKVAFGILTLAIPLAIGLFITRALSSQMALAVIPRGFDSNFSLSMFASSITLYLVIVALTMSFRRESTVAMAGVLIVAFSFFWLVIATAFFGNLFTFDNRLWTIFTLFGNPFLILLSTNQVLDVESFHLLMLLYAIALMIWFRIAAARFGKSSDSSSHSEVRATSAIRMSPITPMNHPRFALFWKEWAEQRWIILGCFLSGLCLSALLGVVAAYQNPNPDPLVTIIRTTTEDMEFLAIFISCIAAIVLGVGSYTTDLDPALVNFWHGLPIPIPLWFRTKYLVSLVGLCALLTAQISIAYFVASLIPGPAAGVIATLHEQTLQILLGGLILLPLVHAFSIFFAAFIRRPIYAAILAIIISITISMLPISKDTQVAQVLFTTGPGHYPLLFTMFMLISALATLTLLLTSRLALIKNWHLA